MAIGIDGSIGSLLKFYKEETRLFGRCPYCQAAFRLSEVKLTYGKEPPRDLLTQMKKERARLKEQLQGLEDDIETLQDDHNDEIISINDRWKERWQIEVDKQLSKTTRQIRKDAIARSRVGQLGKTLEKIAPMFPGFGHHPYDVRPVFDPIDFVVFDGYFQGEVTDITFVEFKTGQSRLNKIQSSIKKTIEKKRVRFEERRLSKEAIKVLTSGNAPKQIRQLIE